MNGMRKIIVLFFIIASMNHNWTWAELAKEDSPLFCDEEFQEIFSLIQNLSEVNCLIDRTLQDGPLYILKNDLYPQTMTGFWQPYHRTIYLTKMLQTTAETLIITLIFELHNAARNNELENIDSAVCRHEFDKDQYVEAKECIEYQNVISTHQILKIGRDSGLFSSECDEPYFPSFQDHLQYQKEMGHSAFFEKRYQDQLEICSTEK